MIVVLDGMKKRVAFRKGKISDLLRLLSVQREEALMKVNGKLAPEDMEIDANDRVEIIKVVFGG